MTHTSRLELLGRREFEVDRIGWRRKQRLVEEGALVLVRPGIYVHGEAWRSLRAEEQIVTRARALERIALHRPVFAGTTAAAIHRLPLFRVAGAALHTIAPTHRPGSAFGVIRHRADLRDSELVEIDGLVCTSLARTVADVARRERIETSVTVADAALRRLAIRADAFGEFDGKVKYTEPGMLAGRTMREAIFEEKRREDWIRGTTQSPFARWEWKHLSSAAALGARLSAFGIVPPRSG